MQLQKPTKQNHAFTFTPSSHPFNTFSISKHIVIGEYKTTYFFGSSRYFPFSSLGRRSHRTMSSVFQEWWLVGTMLGHRAGLAPVAPQQLGGMGRLSLLALASALPCSLFSPQVWFASFLLCSFSMVTGHFFSYQFGSNSPCSPSPCGPGAICEVYHSSKE